MNNLFTWPAKKRSCRLIVMLPIEAIAIYSSQLLRTIALGFIARALAIARVSDLVILCRNPKLYGLCRFSEKVLRYLLTPPYLRKRLVPIDKDLQYVGVLNPLAIPTHPTRDEMKPGNIRPALVEHVSSLNKSIAYVDAGLGSLCRAENCSSVKQGDLVFVEVLSVDPPICKCIDDSYVDIYTGFDIHVYRSLKKAIENLCHNCVVIEFSKDGAELRLDDRLDYLESGKRICLFFGDPDRDPSDIAQDEGFDLCTLVNEVGSTYIKANAFPFQGVRSIRSIEALYVCLSVLNFELYRLGVCM